MLQFFESLSDQSRLELLSHALRYLSPSSILSNHQLLESFSGLVSRASNDQYSKLFLHKTTKANKSEIQITKNLTEIARDCVTEEYFGSEHLQLWTDTEDVLNISAVESDPVKRYAHLVTIENRVAANSKLNRCRHRMVQILQGNERESAAQKFVVNGDANKAISQSLGIPVKTLKNLNTQWTRYMSLIEEFGIGIIPLLGGGHNESVSFHTLLS